MRLLIVLIALCVVVRGQESPSSAPKDTDKPTTGSIGGRVVNDNGQAVAGASATVRLVNSRVQGRTTATDAEGNFRVNNLEPGLYLVTASAPTFTSTPSDPNDPATYYRIGDSVDLRLIRGGVITGAVTNSLGEPVVAVTVRATMIRDSNGQPPRTFIALTQQQTDDRGIYRLYGLPPGTYLVSAGGGIQQSFNFNAYDFDIPTYSPSSTRDTAAEISVRSGEESNADIRYRGEQGYTISGTVKGAGPSNGSSVSLTPVAGSVMPTGNTFQPPGARGFSFNGVGDGDYDLVAQEFSMTQTMTVPVLQMSEPRRVTVKGANVTGIELIPKPLGSVIGRIVLETSQVPACQGKRPPLLAETIVQLRRPEKENERSTFPAFGFVSSGSPDAKGVFTLRNVPAGKYQFEPRFYARYWYLQSITIGAAPAATAAKSPASSLKSDAAANWTVLKFGENLSNLTITLSEGAASVRGKIASAESQPGMVFYLVPSELNKADDVLRFFVTDIGADGTFALNNLPPGRYWALAQPNTGTQTATMMKLRAPEAAAARTKLRKTAETQKAEIELKPCQNLADYELKQ